MNAGDVRFGGELDLSRIDRGVAAMLRRGLDLTPYFKALRVPLRQDQADHARKQEGPDGRWPRRSPFTQARARARARARGRRRSPRLLGRLPTAISVKAMRDRARAYSKVPWSLVHQEGGRVGRGAKVPRRPYLWISGPLFRRAMLLAVDHVIGGWR